MWLPRTHLYVFMSPSSSGVMVSMLCRNLRSARRRLYVARLEASPSLLLALQQDVHCVERLTGRQRSPHRLHSVPGSTVYDYSARTVQRQGKLRENGMLL